MLEAFCCVLVVGFFAVVASFAALTKTSVSLPSKPPHRYCPDCERYTMQWEHECLDGTADMRYKHNLLYCRVCGWVHGSPLPIAVQQRIARREQERQEHIQYLQERRERRKAKVAAAFNATADAIALILNGIVS